MCNFFKRALIVSKFVFLSRATQFSKITGFFVFANRDAGVSQVWSPTVKWPGFFVFSRCLFSCLPNSWISSSVNGIGCSNLAKAREVFWRFLLGLKSSTSSPLTSGISASDPEFGFQSWSSSFFPVLFLGFLYIVPSKSSSEFSSSVVAFKIFAAPAILAFRPFLVVWIAGDSGTTLMVFSFASFLWSTSPSGWKKSSIFLLVLAGNFLALCWTWMLLSSFLSISIVASASTLFLSESCRSFCTASQMSRNDFKSSFCSSTTFRCINNSDRVSLSSLVCLSNFFSRRNFSVLIVLSS